MYAVPEFHGIYHDYRSAENTSVERIKPSIILPKRYMSSHLISYRNTPEEWMAMTLKAKKIGLLLKQQENGKGLRAIARDLKISRNTVKRYVALKENGELRYAKKRPKAKVKAESPQTQKILPKTTTSRHLYSDHNFGNRMKMEECVVGKRTDSVLKKYCEMYAQAGKQEKGKLLDEF